MREEPGLAARVKTYTRGPEFDRVSLNIPSYFPAKLAFVGGDESVSYVFARHVSGWHPFLLVTDEVVYGRVDFFGMLNRRRILPASARKGITGVIAGERFALKNERRWTRRRNRRMHVWVGARELLARWERDGALVFRDCSSGEEQARWHRARWSVSATDPAVRLAMIFLVLIEAEAPMLSPIWTIVFGLT